MNWMSALTLIDCNTVIVDVIEKIIETNLDHALDHCVRWIRP